MAPWSVIARADIPASAARRVMAPIRLMPSSRLNSEWTWRWQKPDSAGRLGTSDLRPTVVNAFMAVAKSVAESERDDGRTGSILKRLVWETRLVASFRYDPDILERFPAVVGGVIHATGVHNGPTPPRLAAAFRHETPPGRPPP